MRALLWLQGHPLHLGVSGFVLCMLWDLMKEGCAHRGIYSVRRDGGEGVLKFGWDCEGLSLGCLPGLCLQSWREELVWLVPV